jgi:hypothetical protein
MENLFKQLEEKYGTHSDVARVLGITPRHYRKIRSGIAPLTDTLELLAMLLLKEKRPINGRLRLGK